MPILDHDGRITWVEKKRTLGDAAATLSTTQSALTLASNVQDQSGQQPTNKTLNDISKVAGTVAGIAAVIPGGQIVAAVAGVVAIAAKVLSGIFGGGPTSEQVLRSLNNSNDDLRAQINTIDSQISKVNDGLKSMYSALQANGFNTRQLQGLGDIFSDMQEVSLQQQANVSLQKILAQKGQQLQTLLQTYTSVVQQVSDAVTTKNTGSKVILWSMAGLAALGLGIYAYETLNNDKDDKDR